MQTQHLKAKVTRFNETMESSKLIHGATDSNPDPAVAGMLNTLTSKVKSKNLSEKILLSKPSLVKELNSTIMNKWSKDKYNSDENKLRSLNVYYSHKVMGKRKYINLRKANKASSSRKSRIPNYIPYNELSTLVNSIDIGTVKDVYDLSPENSDSNLKVATVILLNMFYVLQSFILLLTNIVKISCYFSQLCRRKIRTRCFLFYLLVVMGHTFLFQFLFVYAGDTFLFQF